MPKTSKAAPSRKKAAPKGTAAAGGSSKTEPKTTASSPAKDQPAKTAAGKKPAPVKKAATAKKAAARQPEKVAANKAAPTKKAPPAKKAAPAKKAPPAKKALDENPAPEKPAPASRPGGLLGGSAGSGTVKKAAPAALDPKFLEDQRDLLLSERRAYAEQAVALKAEADQLAAEMEPGDVQFDEESGEGDSIGMERERDLQLAGQARAAIEEIDRALAKVEAGTYGLCERCGQPIPKPRLKALPYAALCVACKSGGLASRR